MAASSMISSSVLVASARAQGLPSLGRSGSSFAVVCGTGKKIKADKPFGSC
jgi:photosystem II 10kDa protein